MGPDDRTEQGARDERPDEPDTGPGPAGTPGAGHPTSGRQEEIITEQRVVDVLYARLDELRASTRSRLAGVRRTGPSGSPQNRSERDAFATLYEDRLAQLESVEERLAFGRLDLEDQTTRYVGRIGLSDEEHTSILTDWRAPAAQSFYRATAAHPDGVRRRRHLVTKGRSVTGIEDEVLDLASDTTAASSLSGEGALLAAMAAGRTGRMGDIVATIQAEQDAIIRSELAGALVVQGGPGTGKTAVALHRAAYLLYAHRRLLERSGVLLVGPSLSFLHYIDQVLPSLGETGVVSTTIAELLPGWSPTARSRRRWPASRAERHGRGSSSERCARDSACPPRTSTCASTGTTSSSGGPTCATRSPRRTVRTSRTTSRGCRSCGRCWAARRPVRHAARRPRRTRGARRGHRRPAAPARDPDRPQPRVDASDPRTPDRGPLRQASPARRGRTRHVAGRPCRARAPKGSPWTPADVPLLDEAAELLGEDDQAARAQAKAEAADRAANLEYARQVLESSGAGGGIVGAEILADRFAGGGSRLTTAERAAQDRTWTYAHVVVDEAQELSAMAWRALVRRCPTRSMTIVGDVAQTSSLAGARSWAGMLDPLLRNAWRLSTLTVNYRTPTQIADTAQRFAAASRLPTSSLTSARDVPGALVLAPVGGADALLRGLPAGPVHAGRVRRARRRRPRGRRRPGRRVTEVREHLARAHAAEPLLTDRAPGVPGALAAALTVLSPTQSKGLEFDAVVLVEPAEILTATSGPPTSTSR
ncbi:AAA family ATPase [Oerskovia sp. M15]